MIVGDAGDLLDQVLAGRIVPAVNGVRVVGHAGDHARLDPPHGRGYICWMLRRPKDTPAKLASRIKRRWRIVLMRKTGEVLGTVEAADAHAAEKVTAIQFNLDEVRRNRIMMQEMG
jgi:hypothetical protein